ncbi:UDP-glucose/GDP-mannose dehydrogenase family protein [uncultured Rikenella sp.]|uniref:UDP-glucose dehydrogenase family protein n=1 Tax=uncultured Rikenella sp. TaxID=368003 RepID=UPI002605AD9B|nr:UDP-glucose/GDP-mannose dehydrogenase family protein [uncultured Rikenella sp.]
MKIAIVGTGYVGLVTGTCFAELGVDVTCVDTDASKIDRLRKGIIPIYEPNLELLVEKNHKAGRLHFTTSLEEVLPQVEIVFSAVGTPPDEDGSADLRYVLQVARTIGRSMDRYVLVVTKSTVPVGTAVKVRAAIQEELDKRGVQVPFDVASNPEFLKEGNAIEDFMRPDRVVVGTDSERARDLMTKLYKPLLLNNFRVMFMDIPSAEMTKYAANAMLATRISFINDVANLCQAVGADVNMVRKGIGADSRIGNKFLYPGCGYGGSCFPKDIKALIRSAQENGCRMEVLEAVERVNERQKGILFEKLASHFGGAEALRGKRIALWGLAFKPGTDDMREAPSLVLIPQLLAAGAEVVAYDPVAMDEAKRRLGEEAVSYASDAYSAVSDADALVLLTEWKEFRLPNWEVVRRAMRGSGVVDGRNIFDRNELRALGFDYYGIGVL